MYADSGNQQSGRRIQIPGVEVTCIHNGMPVVILRAKDVGFVESEREAMKTIARWSIAVATVGMFVLPLTGQTKNDAAPAQGPKPIMMYRFYEGTDGLSHVEKIELKDFDVHNAVSLMAGSGIPTIHRDKPDPPGTALSSMPFHPAARRQYIFNLQGHVEIEFSGGEKITLNPGDIELAEDVAPSKGHRNLIPGPEDRISVWFPITDQTPAIGPSPI